MRDLTPKQALAEAQRRWGKGAVVEQRGKCRRYVIPEKHAGSCTGRYSSHAPGCPGGVPMYTVGRLAMGGLFMSVEARGVSFRECFARVDRDIAVDKARWCKRKDWKRGGHREGHVCPVCGYDGPAGREAWAQIIDGKLVSFEEDKP